MVPSLGTEHSVLGPGREFDLIRAIWSRLGDRIAGAPGDDCAFVAVEGRQLAVSSDIAIEGTHFQVGWLSHHEVGWRAAAAALSDLAAVAARPAGVLVSLGVPAEWPEECVVDVMDGVGAAAAAAGAAVLGGDVVCAPRCVIDVMCLGSGAPFVRRTGAAAGDGLWVTGRLGGALMALEALNAGREPETTARERFARPVPRIAEAQWLRDHGAKAMIDVSDGLVADAGHIAAASGVGLVIEAQRVPAHPSVSSGPSAASAPLACLISGEEYELLVALPADFDAADGFMTHFDVPLTRVGTVRAGAGVMVERDGRPVELPQGWSHFG